MSEGSDDDFNVNPPTVTSPSRCMAEPENTSGLVISEETRAFPTTNSTTHGRTVLEFLSDFPNQTGLPFFDLNTIYVLLSRHDTADALQCLKHSPAALANLLILQGTIYSMAWNGAYDTNGFFNAAKENNLYLELAP